MAGAIRYLCLVRLDGQKRIVLWEASDDGSDRLVVDERGAVVYFHSEAQARLANNSGAHRLSAEATTTYDFDAVRSWCLSDDPSIDCSKVLDIWNFLADLPSENELFAAADSRAGEIYEKLFHGCNLPAMGGGNGEYVPNWTCADIASLKRLVVLGINDFQSRCGTWQAIEQDVTAEKAGPRS